jgi:uncharacterized protein (TIGR02757 family)
MNFSTSSLPDLQEFLDKKYQLYHQQIFIETDPIQIPHLFTKPEDIEISGFLSATFAWGNRNSIIRSSKKLIQLMDNAPSDFIRNYEPSDLKIFESFKHRTFNFEDLIYFFSSLQNMYRNHGGLKQVFESAYLSNGSVKSAISNFRDLFLSLPHLRRTEKHIANVEKKSTGKRINMFLRWMVRPDNAGIDFGLWNQIPTSKLYLPLDVHTGNISRKLGLLTRKQNDWQAVEEITNQLRVFDKNDPVKYDFALFGLGVFEKLI